MESTLRAVVIGDIEVARRTCTELRRRGHQVRHLLQPSDSELRAALTDEASAVAVLIRGDVIALRYALLVEHLLPRVRLVVTLFDRTVSDQLVRVVPNCQITSPADISVPSILGACLGDEVLAIDQRAERPMVLSAQGDGVTLTPWLHRPHRGHRLLNTIAGQARPHDATTRILFIGLAGLLATVLLDWLLAVHTLHQGVLQALYAATRVVATVGPGDADAHAPGWYLVFASVCMLARSGSPRCSLPGWSTGSSPPAVSASSVPAPSRRGTMSSWSGWARSACGSASACAPSASMWWPSSATRGR